MNRRVPPSRLALTAAAAVVAAVVAAVAGCASTAPLDPQRFGLRRASVFDVVPATSFVFTDAASAKATATARPRAGSGEPPMISHAIDESLPLTPGDNGCLTCHDKPASIGRPVAAGKARPMSADHYVGGGDARQLRGTMFNCTACHAPQVDVPALVTTTMR